MNLSFKILGYEIWTLELEFGDDEAPKVSVLDKATKAVSRHWVNRMIRG